MMAFLPVHQGAANDPARGCKGGDGEGGFCWRRKKAEIQSCKDTSETLSAAEQTSRVRRWFWEYWRIEEWIRTYRILRMKNITEIKLKYSFLLCSKLKSTDWLILNPKCYGPGAGTDHSASFHHGCCPFLEKVTTTEVWTGTVATFSFGMMVRRADKSVSTSLCSGVQHRISRSCYSNCHSKLGLKISKLLKG